MSLAAWISLLVCVSAIVAEVCRESSSQSVCILGTIASWLAVAGLPLLLLALLLGGAM